MTDLQDWGEVACTKALWWELASEEMSKCQCGWRGQSSKALQAMPKAM